MFYCDERTDVMIKQKYYYSKTWMINRIILYKKEKRLGRSWYERRNR
jgi:hypothetical protein